MSFKFNPGDPDVDFDEFYGYWVTLAELEHKREIIKEQLDRYIARCKRTAMNSGDRVTAEYLRGVVEIIGNNSDDEKLITTMKVDLSNVEMGITKTKGMIDKMHNQIKTWQTISANQRRTFIE
jgi:hypothetical protein